MKTHTPKLEDDRNLAPRNGAPASQADFTEPAIRHEPAVIKKETQTEAVDSTINNLDAAVAIYIEELAIKNRLRPKGREKVTRLLHEATSDGKIMSRDDLMGLIHRYDYFPTSPPQQAIAFAENIIARLTFLQDKNKHQEQSSTEPTQITDTKPAEDADISHTEPVVVEEIPYAEPIVEPYSKPIEPKGTKPHIPQLDSTDPYTKPVHSTNKAEGLKKTLSLREAAIFLKDETMKNKDYLGEELLEAIIKGIEFSDEKKLIKLAKKKFPNADEWTIRNKLAELEEKVDSLQRQDGSLNLVKRLNAHLSPEDRKDLIPLDSFDPDAGLGRQKQTKSPITETATMDQIPRRLSPEQYYKELNTISRVWELEAQNENDHVKRVAAKILELAASGHEPNQNVVKKVLHERFKFSREYIEPGMAMALKKLEELYALIKKEPEKVSPLRRITKSFISPFKKAPVEWQIYASVPRISQTMPVIENQETSEPAKKGFLSTLRESKIIKPLVKGIATLATIFTLKSDQASELQAPIEPARVSAQGLHSAGSQLENVQLKLTQAETPGETPLRMQKPESETKKPRATSEPYIRPAEVEVARQVTRHDIETDHQDDVVDLSSDVLKIEEDGDDERLKLIEERIDPKKPKKPETKVPPKRYIKKTPPPVPTSLQKNKVELELPLLPQSGPITADWKQAFDQAAIPVMQQATQRVKKMTPEEQAALQNKAREKFTYLGEEMDATKQAIEEAADDATNGTFDTEKFDKATKPVIDQFKQEIDQIQILLKKKGPLTPSLAKFLSGTSSIDNLSSTERDLLDQVTKKLDSKTAQSIQELIKEQLKESKDKITKTVKQLTSDPDINPELKTFLGTVKNLKINNPKISDKNAINQALGKNSIAVQLTLGKQANKLLEDDSSFDGATIDILKLIAKK